ncbi:hypothetical protein V3C99_015866 [Haemonchus contortus]
MTPSTTRPPPLTIEDFRLEASTKLKKIARDYYEAGSDDQLTLNRNESAFKRFLIRPRCLRDVSHAIHRCSGTEGSIGTRLSQLKNMAEIHCGFFPIGIAPTAFHRMATKDGELSTAEGASATGTLMIASSWSTTSIEEIAMEAKEKNVELWFQLYVYKDKTITSGLVSRAEACGCKALVLTVDTPVLGRRLPDIRNAFTLPDGLR